MCHDGPGFVDGIAGTSEDNNGSVRSIEVGHFDAIVEEIVFGPVELLCEPVDGETARREEVVVNQDCLVGTLESGVVCGREGEI